MGRPDHVVTGRDPQAACADRPLIDAIRLGLRSLADPTRARRQQAYMKSAMPFAGVAVPDVRRITRQVAAGCDLDEWQVWRDTVLALWREATVREERYAATDLAGLPASRRHARSLASLPMWDEFVVDGAWWDHVDAVAIHLVGPLLGDHRAEVTPVIRSWSTHDDRWRRRSSIICQVGAGRSLDPDLLRSCIEANLADPDFFVRKAIGWALRQHARVDPGWVRSFVAGHDTLSPLSRREALRLL